MNGLILDSRWPLIRPEGSALSGGSKYSILDLVDRNKDQIGN